MPTSHSRQTSGTTHRAARQMSGRGHVFELTDEVRTLRGELGHTSGGRAAKTLAKTDGLRVTLVLLTSGANAQSRIDRRRRQPARAQGSSARASRG